MTKIIIYFAINHIHIFGLSVFIKNNKNKAEINNIIVGINQKVMQVSLKKINLTKLI